jgi:hypothetical protein
VFSHTLSPLSPLPLSRLSVSRFSVSRFSVSRLSTLTHSVFLSHLSSSGTRSYKILCLVKKRWEYLRHTEAHGHTTQIQHTQKHTHTHSYIHTIKIHVWANTHTHTHKCICMCGTERNTQIQRHTNPYVDVYYMFTSTHTCTGHTHKNRHIHWQLHTLENLQRRFDKEAMRIPPRSPPLSPPPPPSFSLHPPRSLTHTNTLTH